MHDDETKSALRHQPGDHYPNLMQLNAYPCVRVRVTERERERSKRRKREGRGEQRGWKERQDLGPKMYERTVTERESEQEMR